MKCDNKLCIFQENGECLKNTIEIDYRGNCKNMIFMRVTQDNLELNKFYSRVKLEADIKDGKVTNTDYLQIK